MLQQVNKEQLLSRSTVFLWHKRFREGNEKVEDDPRYGTIFAQTLSILRSSVIICQKCLFSLIRVHLRSVAQLTDGLHAPFSLQARHWFHFYWWKAFHSWDHPQLPHFLL